MLAGPVVCEVKTRGGRERTVRACTATPRDEDVVDVSSGDATGAMMAASRARTALTMGWHPRRRPGQRAAAAVRVRDARGSPASVFADDDEPFLGGAAPRRRPALRPRPKNHTTGADVRVGVRRRSEIRPPRQPRVGRTAEAAALEDRRR